MVLLKAVLLLSAFAAVSLRLLAHKNAELLGATADTMNIIAFISMGVCLLCAGIWAIILKKEEKANKENEEAEDISEDNDGI